MIENENDLLDLYFYLKVDDLTLKWVEAAKAWAPVVKENGPEVNFTGPKEGSFRRKI